MDTKPKRAQRVTTKIITGPPPFALSLVLFVFEGKPAKTIEFIVTYMKKTKTIIVTVTAAKRVDPNDPKNNVWKLIGYVPDINASYEALYDIKTMRGKITLTQAR